MGKDTIVVPHTDKRQIDCSECGKPLQYCECKFTKQTRYIRECESVGFMVLTIAPVTLKQYFEQIGSE